MRRFKKTFIKILMWFIFVTIVTAPFWSVVIVMELEAAITRPVYWRETWLDRQYGNARYKATLKHLGLEAKYVNI